MENSTTSVEGIVVTLCTHLYISNIYRLEKLTELLETVGVYSALSLSHIEGIEQLNSRFNLAYTSLKKKPYDVLDQRKMDFDSDYDDFKRQLLELNVCNDTV